MAGSLYTAADTVCAAVRLQRLLQELERGHEVMHRHLASIGADQLLLTRPAVAGSLRTILDVSLEASTWQVGEVTYA